MIDSGMVGRKVLVPRGEKVLYSGADPEAYITEYTLVYEDKPAAVLSPREGKIDHRKLLSTLQQTADRDWLEGYLAHKKQHCPLGPP